MNLGSVFAGAAPALGALAGSVFGSAGSVLGGSIGQGIGSAYQAQQMMDFQRDMSNTAYQRRAADLQAAGLNPVLAVSSGPAGVPGGAMGQVPQSPGMEVSTAKDVSRRVSADADSSEYGSEAAKWDAQTAQQRWYLTRADAIARGETIDDQVRAAKARLKADLASSRNDEKFELGAGGVASRWLRGVVGPGVSSAAELLTAPRRAGMGSALGAGLSSAVGASRVEPGLRDWGSIGPYSRTTPGPGYVP